MSNQKMFNLENFADGALAEQINEGLRAVIENITDPNTSWKEKRKLNVTLTFEADEERELAEVTIVVKPTLAPAAPSKTRIIIDRDKEGKAVAAEYRKGVPGQIYIETSGDIEPLSDEPELPAGLRVVGGK